MPEESFQKLWYVHQLLELQAMVVHQFMEPAIWTSGFMAHRVIDVQFYGAFLILCVSKTIIRITIKHFLKILFASK